MQKIRALARSVVATVALAAMLASPAQAAGGKGSTFENALLQLIFNATRDLAARPQRLVEPGDQPLRRAAHLEPRRRRHPVDQRGGLHQLRARPCGAFVLGLDGVVELGVAGLHHRLPGGDRRVDQADIPPGTTVEAVSATSVTMTSTATGSGIAAGDSIGFV